MSPQHGARIIEIGATKINSGIVVDRFQTLTNPRKKISSKITGITGITNEMLVGQPSCAEGILGLYDFIDGCSLVAHNRAFDKRFLVAELGRVGKEFVGDFFCSLLLSKRVWPAAGGYNLESLLDFNNIDTGGGFHRAQYDADKTAELWIKALLDLSSKLNRPKITDIFINQICVLDKKKAQAYIKKWSLPKE